MRHYRRSGKNESKTKSYDGKKAQIPFLFLKHQELLREKVVIFKEVEFRDLE